MAEDPNDPLSRALSGLVGEGSLTDAQAAAVRSAYDQRAGVRSGR